MLINEYKKGVYKRSLQGNASSTNAQIIGAQASKMAEIGAKLAERNQLQSVHQKNPNFYQKGETPQSNMCTIIADNGENPCGLSRKSIELRAKVKEFVEENIIPLEKELYTWHTQLSEKRWEVHPAIEELKCKAKKEGLWNLFLPKYPPSTFFRDHILIYKKKKCNNILSA